MKKILCIVLLLFFGTVSAQDEINDFLETVITESKNQYPVDLNDLTMNQLFEDFYNEILQSDQGEISEELISKITTLADNPETKNMHLLSLLLVFQEYINETSENEELVNSEFQLKLLEALENEFTLLKQNIPTLLYVYKIEALQNNEMFTEADELTQLAYQKFPDSVPIKIFQYLSTNDQNIKNDLISKHSNHWFVKQLEYELQ